MMSRSLVAAAVALGVSACTPMMWSRPGFGPAEARSDYAECSREAWHEANIFRWRQDLRRLGYPRRFDRRRHFDGFDDFNTFSLQSDLTSFCMRAKGYGLVPADPGPG